MVKDPRTRTGYFEPTEFEEEEAIEILEAFDDADEFLNDDFNYDYLFDSEE